MRHKDITYYINCFKKLRRDKKNGGAPHKPILLISLIQAFQQKKINSININITPDLVGLFKSNWNDLVTSNHNCLFSLPFYHMQSEPFWELIPAPGCELWVKSKSSMRSIVNLKTAVKHAQIDEELAELLKNIEASNILLDFLVTNYFGESYKKLNYTSFFDEIENQLEETSLEYRSRIVEMQKKSDNDSFQEEVFIRSNIFTKKIKQIYNSSCCISSLRVDSLLDISMIDACHIVPFSQSYNDTLTNGIALTPTLHRAFDRGLISIDDNYTVIVNNNFEELVDTAYSIKQFDGKQILLPELEKNYPALENLQFHRKLYEFRK